MDNVMRALELIIAANIAVQNASQAIQSATRTIERARREGRDISDKELEDIRIAAEDKLNQWRQGRDY